MGYGAPPPQQGFGAPGYGPPGPQPADYGGQPGFGQPPQQQQWGPPGGAPMMQHPGGGMAQPGAHGPKGVVRSGMMVLVWSFVSCGLYQLWWFISVCNEMSTFLQRDEPAWWKVILLSSVTCGLYGLYWQIAKCGALIQEVQQRAGVPNAQNHGFMYVIPYYQVILMQEELNKAWSAVPG
jgi:hypothetical protein